MIDKSTWVDPRTIRTDPRLELLVAEQFQAARKRLRVCPACKQDILDDPKTYVIVKFHVLSSGCRVSILPST